MMSLLFFRMSSLRWTFAAIWLHSFKVMNVLVEMSDMIEQSSVRTSQFQMFRLYFSIFSLSFSSVSVSLWTLHPMVALLTVSALLFYSEHTKSHSHTLIHLPCIQTHTLTYQFIGDVCFLLNIDQDQTDLRACYSHLNTLSSGINLIPHML